MSQEFLSTSSMIHPSSVLLQKKSRSLMALMVYDEDEAGGGGGLELFCWEVVAATDASRSTSCTHSRTIPLAIMMSAHKNLMIATA